MSVLKAPPSFPEDAGALRNLDMDVLRTFVLGIQLGSFSRAAARIGRSQSAVSLQLRKLEQQSGEQLFVRSGRGLALTEAGQTLHDYAMRLVNLNDEAVNAVRMRHIRGTVRIGVPPDFAETWLPDVLGRFGRAHPQVELHARVDRAQALLEDLRNGDLDISICWRFDHKAQPEAGAAARQPDPPASRVGEAPLAWLGPRSVFGAHAAGALPHHSSGPVPLVLIESPCMFREIGVAALDAAGISWRVSFSSSSLSGLWAAVEAGLGIAIRTTEGIPPGVIPLKSKHLGLPALGTAGLWLHEAEDPGPAVRQFRFMLEQSLAMMLKA